MKLKPEIEEQLNFNNTSLLDYIFDAGFWLGRDPKYHNKELRSIVGISGLDIETEECEKARKEFFEMTFDEE